MSNVVSTGTNIAKIWFSFHLVLAVSGLQNIVIKFFPMGIQTVSDKKGHHWHEEKVNPFQLSASVHLL